MRILQIFRKNILIFFILFLSLVVNIGAIFYYLYSLNNISLILTIFLSILISFSYFYFIIYKRYQQEENIIKPKIKISDYFSFVLSSALFLFLIFILFKNGSDSAIISPWHLLPIYFFSALVVFLSAVFYSFYKKSYFSKIIIFLVYSLFFSISFFIYKIAFGYDQLLHQRALSEILQFGFINPKTFYYIGQYSLEFSLVKLLPFSLETISRGLVPFLSAILIPFTFLFNFKNKNKDIYFVLLLFLLLPFSIFTYTVPQNLAFLFLILIILFSFNADFLKNKYNFLFLFSLALSSFFIHPLAGIPAVIFVAMRALSSFRMLGSRSTKIKCLLTFGLYLSQIIILPVLLFLVGGKLAIPQINFDFLIPRILGQESVYLNFVYFFFFNKFFIFAILIILSIYLFIKKYKFHNIYLLNFFALFFSYLVSLFVAFPFLSDIDKNSYSQRILIISLLFLIPVFYNFFSDLVERVKSKNFYFRFYVSIFFVLFLITSLYLNYPRKDNYFNSRGYSVSASDFTAVKFIEDIKINDNYIVLANQQVGAAAIKELGFKRYYDGWLYYSVQTGGLFYDYYLKMLDRPNRELIEELLSQVEADNAYLVVNDYWWAYERIINEMKVEADNYYQTSDGKVSVFHFDLTK